MNEIDACWSRIGIAGNHSCPELVRVIHCRNCAVFTRAARQALDRPAPADYLEQWAERVAAAAERDGGEVLSTVVFRLGGTCVALPTSVFIEAVDPCPVHRIPHRTHTVLLGVANIRGELQLCVSLGALLAIDAEAVAVGRPRLAVIEQDDGRWAFPVDDMLGVHRIARDDLASPPPDAGAFVQARFALDGAAVELLDAALVGSALRRAVA